MPSEYKDNSHIVEVDVFTRNYILQLHRNNNFLPLESLCTYALVILLPQLKFHVVQLLENGY